MAFKSLIGGVVESAFGEGVWRGCLSHVPGCQSSQGTPTRAFLGKAIIWIPLALPASQGMAGWPRGGGGWGEVFMQGEHLLELGIGWT